MQRIFPVIAALVLTGLTTLYGCSGRSTDSSSTAPSDAGTSTPIGSGNAPAPLPDRVLSASDLVAYAKYRLTYIPPDQFTKEPNDAVLDGRKFHLEIKGVGDGIDAPLGSVPLTTTYDVDKETLEMRVNSSEEVSNSESVVVNYLALHEEDQNMSPEIMTNAFGVRKEITYIKKIILGVGNSGAKIGAFKPISHDNGFVYDLTKKMHVTADQARRYDKKYILTVDGDILLNPKGKAIECFHDKEQATINKTYPSDETDCIINAKLHSIAVLDPERHVLAQWGVR